MDRLFAGEKTLLRKNEVPEGTYTSIQQGKSHSCVLDTDNYVICWGDDYYYDNTTTPNKRYQKYDWETI